MINQSFAETFATEWIAAWNAHDLDRILAHYTDDFEMSSPYIVKYGFEASGTIRGKPAVRAYWQSALERRSDLHFKLVEIHMGVDTICLYYQSAPGMRAIEWFLFATNGKVKKAIAHYDP